RAWPARLRCPSGAIHAGTTPPACLRRPPSTPRRRPALPLLAFTLEPGNPLFDHRQLLAVQLVNTALALLLVGDQLRVFKHAQMTRRRRPGMLEAPRDIAGAHRITTKPQGHQHL